MGTVNFQMFKLVLEKSEDLEIGLPKPIGSSKKQECARKIAVSALLITPKTLTVWITTNYGKFFFFFGKFLKRWEYQTTLPPS